MCEGLELTQQSVADGTNHSLSSSPYIDDRKL